MKQKNRLLDLTIQFVLVFIAVAVAIISLGVKRLPIAKTEADAVNRWADKWEECFSPPGMKVDVVKKEFIFFCQQ